MQAESRRIWKCPGCGSKWQLPTHVVEPRFCPRCEKASTGIPPELPEMPIIIQSASITKRRRQMTDVSIAMVHTVICVLIVSAAYVFGMLMSESRRPDDKALAGLYTAIATTILLIPAFIAGIRRHPFVLPIYVISFFLGWTCVAWIGVMIWAVWPIKRS